MFEFSNFDNFGDYLGAFLLISGLFLILAGLGILKIEKTITKGWSTWVIGFIIAFIGMFFIFSSNNSPNSNDALVSETQYSENDTEPNIVVETPENDTEPNVVVETPENDTEQIVVVETPENNIETSESIPGEISFVEDGDSDFSDLDIQKIHAEINGEYIHFTIEYVVEFDRIFTFFDPPGGDLIMYINPLPANQNQVTFKISIDDLKKVENITMKFYSETKEAIIFLDFEDINLLLDEIGNLSESPESPPGDISFVENEGGDFSELNIFSVHAEIIEEFMHFTLEYFTGYDRNFNVFDPPTGVVIKYANNLPAHLNQVTFKFSIDDLKKVEFITINFSSDTVRTGIFLDIEDIRSLIDN